MKYLAILILSVTGGLFGGYYSHSTVDAVRHVFGATTARTTITNPWTFSATTTLSKPLIVTTTNTATSTTSVGCLQFTATSTQTPIKLVPAAFSSTTVTFGNGTVGFPLLAVFGYCPNLP